MLKIDRTGEQNKAKNGLMMTIIAYRHYHDIDVQFEDGFIVYHKSYNNFINGIIRHPNYLSYTRRNNSYMKNRIDTSRVGERRIATNGMWMTCIAYRNSSDIDIQFEDGTIVKHRKYYNFKIGQIEHPTIKKHTNIHRLGETHTTTRGQIAEIIKYRSSMDMDVKLDDGSIIKHTTYRKFKLGYIKPSSLSTRLGQSFINKQGFTASIIEYVSSMKIKLKFDTGYIPNKYYPYYRVAERLSFEHPLPYIVNNVSINKPAYIVNNIGNFYCTCTKCGHKDIWTVEEVKRHICE